MSDRQQAVSSVATLASGFIVTQRLVVMSNRVSTGHVLARAEKSQKSTSEIGAEYAVAFIVTEPP